MKRLLQPCAFLKNKAENWFISDFQVMEFYVDKYLALYPRKRITNPISNRIISNTFKLLF